MTGFEENGIHWEGTPESLRRWKDYKRRKAITFVSRGYSVSWYPDGDNTMDVYTPERWYAKEPELRAMIKFFNEPSQYGIDHGKISKLAIQVRSVDVLAKVVGRPHETITTLFNYDRGDDIDRLHDHAGARALCDLVLTELN